MRNLTIGRHVHHKTSSRDTFGWARSLWQSAADGTVLIADRLEQARGRQGRSWEWQEGQVNMTIILKPHHAALEAPEAANHLIMALSTALCRALHEHDVVLKWPNDLMLHGKKLGGLLVESLWHEGRISAFIAGFAININNEFAPEHYLARVATSLKQETALSHDLTLLQESLFTSLSTWYDAWKLGSFEMIYAAWRACQGYLDKEITIHTKDSDLLTGIMEDVLASGDLLLRPRHGASIVVPFHLVEEVKS